MIIETCPKCGRDLFDFIICTNPPTPKKECLNCGWTWEGKMEEVIRVPFNERRIKMKIPKFNWIAFDRNHPPTDLLEEKEYLILLREDNYDNGATWTYHVDIATAYGSYLDGFWNTNNDWDEGQRIEVLAYCELPCGMKEEDLVDDIRIVEIEAVGEFIHSSVVNGVMKVDEGDEDDWLRDLVSEIEED